MYPLGEQAASVVLVPGDACGSVDGKRYHRWNEIRRVDMPQRSSFVLDEDLGRIIDSAVTLYALAEGGHTRGLASEKVERVDHVNTQSGLGSRGTLGRIEPPRRE